MKIVFFFNGLNQVEVGIVTREVGLTGIKLSFAAALCSDAPSTLLFWFMSNSLADTTTTTGVKNNSCPGICSSDRLTSIDFQEFTANIRG